MQTETKLVTLEEVNRLLTDIVSEVPEDYVYVSPDGNRAGDGFTNCEYATPEGAPSCLVGHVFHRLGFPIKHSGEDGAFALVFGKNAPHEDRFTREAAKRLADVQCRQDFGTPWHEAIK